MRRSGVGGVEDFDLAGTRSVKGGDGHRRQAERRDLSSTKI